MRHIAIATCEQYKTLFADEKLLIPELSKRGIDSEAATWNDPSVDWRRFKAVIVRTTWDYYHKPREFLNWINHIEQLGVRLWNPPNILRSNIDKQYLKELKNKGAPTIPTIWINPEQPLSLVAATEQLGGDEYVLKPTISGGAHQTYRFKRNDAQQFEESLERILKGSWAMVQPFIQDVVQHGEWSFIFIGGEYSHAVLKVPQNGDFRVQFTHGAATTLKQPPHDLIEAAQHILARFEGPLLYGRVDLIPYKDSYLVGEVELTEPCLYLSYDPEAPSRFADAIAIRVPH